MWSASPAFASASAGARRRASSALSSAAAATSGSRTLSSSWRLRGWATSDPNHRSLSHKAGTALSTFTTSPISSAAAAAAAAATNRTILLVPGLPAPLPAAGSAPFSIPCLSSPSPCLNGATPGWQQQPQWQNYQAPRQLRNRGVDLRSVPQADDDMLRRLLSTTIFFQCLPDSCSGGSHLQLVLDADADGVAGYSTPDKTIVVADPSPHHDDDAEAATELIVMSSTLKKRRAKMNKHKLRKRRKLMRLKSK